MKQNTLFFGLILLAILIVGCSGQKVVNNNQNEAINGNMNAAVSNDCEIGKEYERNAIKSVGCQCPSGYEFKIVSMGWGPCPEVGMSDCAAATLKCVKQTN